MSKELLHERLMRLWVERGSELRSAIEKHMPCNVELSPKDCPRCSTLNLFNTLMAEIHACYLISKPDQ